MSAKIFSTAREKAENLTAWLSGLQKSHFMDILYVMLAMHNDFLKLQYAIFAQIWFKKVVFRKQPLYRDQ